MHEASYAPTPPAATRGTVLALGLTAALFAMLQVFVTASAARANQSGILAMQHSLVDLSRGGGAVIEPRFVQLIPLWVATYASAAFTFLITLAICWYAGRLTAALGRDRAAQAAAGRTVALVSSGIWLIATLLAAGIAHADGSFAWLLATAAAIFAAPPGQSITGVFVTQPSGIFLALQLSILFIQSLLGALLAIGLGMFAGRLGGESVPNAGAPARPWTPPPMPPAWFQTPGYGEPIG